MFRRYSYIIITEHITKHELMRSLRIICAEIYRGVLMEILM